MTQPDPVRRRLLTLIGGLAGAAVGAGAFRLLGRDPEAAPATSLPQAAPTSTRPPAGTAPTAPSTTTTAGPPTTTEATTTAEPTTATTEATTATTAAPITVELTVLCREAWGARAAGSGMEPHTIERLTVHHTAVRLDSVDLAPARARAHQAFHMNDRGWPDLAYHFLVDPAGHVYEGRSVEYRGDTATAYDPTGHFLVCLEGDYDVQTPTPTQLASVVSLLAWGAERFGVDPATLGGHRDYAGTSCPGDNVYALLADGSLETALRRRLEQNAPKITVLCGEEGRAAVDAIERA